MANLALTVLAQLLLGGLFTLFRNHHSQLLFTKELVRHTYYLHIGYLGMADEELFDFAWKDIFATANNHVFETANEINIASRIHSCKIAGVQPALAINCFRSLIRHVVVAIHDKVSSTAQFSTLSAMNSLSPSWIDDFHFAMRHGYAHCCRFQFESVLLQCQGNSCAGLGLTENYGHICPHTLFHLLHQVHRHG